MNKQFPGISNAIFQGRPVTENDIQSDRERETKAYLSLPEPFIPYAQVCVEVAGLVFSKHHATDWIKTFGEWMDDGYTPEQVKEAIRAIRSDPRGVLISRPGTITHKLVGLAALRRSTKAPGIDRAGIEATKRMLDEKEVKAVPPPPEVLAKIRALSQKMKKD